MICNRLRLNEKKFNFFRKIKVLYLIKYNIVKDFKKYDSKPKVKNTNKL